MGIDALAIGGLGLAVAGLISLAIWRSIRHRAACCRQRIHELVIALCALNARVTGDAELARLLLVHLEAPHRLGRVDRVRARAWFDNARRLHQLLREELEACGSSDPRLARLTPSMGEAVGGHARDDEDGLSNLTLIDPEFMAMIDAMRSNGRPTDHVA